MACKVNNRKFNSHCAELLACPSYKNSFNSLTTGVLATNGAIKGVFLSKQYLITISPLTIKRKCLNFISLKK